MLKTEAMAASLRQYPWVQVEVPDSVSGGVAWEIRTYAGSSRLLI